MDRVLLSNGSIVEMESVRLPDGEMVKEFDLPSGAARVRVAHVPPYMVANAIGNRPDLADAPQPLVEVKGIGEKWLPVRKGQPGYDEWRREQDEREKARGAAQDDIYWDYGVAEWKLPDGEKWKHEPPSGWSLSKRMERMGVTPRTGDGRRIDYIRYVLAVTNLDVEIVQDVMFGVTRPITEGEVDAVSRLFQDNPDEAAGPTGTAE